MNGRPLRIGITIGLRDAAESLWLNGIKQNALYLAKLFQGSAYGHRVALLNTTGIALTDEIPWDRTVFTTLPFEEGWQGLDVLIELGGQIDGDQTARLKAQGTKIVSYCCGPEYVQNIEAMIFGRKLYDSVFVNERYDELWIIPQIWGMNRGFLETLRRCPAREVPFVWDPMALQAATRDLPERGEYRPGTGGKRLSVVEPNVDVLKFCLYPIFIAERAYRLAPDRVFYLHVANAEWIARQSTEFISLMHCMDLVKAGKASFIGRVTTPYFLAEHTDIMISHQWGLPLNYIYLECCWQGYPLVHNAEIVSDLGYYYPENDLETGARHVLDIADRHDRTWQEYTARQRALIARFQADNPALIRAYDDLLFGLVQRQAA
jgi:hypothetical protein